MFIWIIITVVPIYILHWLVKGLVRVVLPGPIEKNFPKELITKATVHNRGKYDYRCNGCLLTLIWVDKRSIYMITTIHPAGVPICLFRWTFRHFLGADPSSTTRKMIPIIGRASSFPNTNLNPN